MDRVSARSRRRGLAVAFALAPTISLAQQNPGISARPSGQTLDGPAAEEQLVDLSRPEMAQSALAPTTADSEYFDAAMRGEAWAQTKLGKSYVVSSDDPLRLQQGIHLLRQAAEQNDPEALLELSSLAASGIGMGQSDLEAFSYCSRAARSGAVQAMHRLGIMYADGRGTAQDRSAAVIWFRKAAAQGYSPAKHALALALLESQKESESNAEAIGWLESAAKDGHREALFFLAGATAHGDYGLVKDERKAAEMALPKAEAGDAEFQFALATLYLRGESFTGQRSEGKRWLRKAAEAGHPEALKLLGE